MNTLLRFELVDIKKQPNRILLHKDLALEIMLWNSRIM